jgi:hypothetical protein
MGPGWYVTVEIGIREVGLPPISTDSWRSHMGAPDCQDKQVITLTSFLDSSVSPLVREIVQWVSDARDALAGEEGDEWDLEAELALDARLFKEARPHFPHATEGDFAKAHRAYLLASRRGADFFLAEQEGSLH